MNGFDLVTVALIGVEYALGVAVLATNPRRALNQTFCLLSLCTATWMLCLQTAFHESFRTEVILLIQICTVLGSVFPTGYNQLRIAITRPDLTLRQVFWENRHWLGVTVAMGALGFTPWYIKDVVMPASNADHTAFTVPQPVYGPAFAVWGIAYVILTTTLVTFYVRSIRRTQGRPRMDLQVILGGLCCTLLFGILCTIILPQLRGDFKSMRLVPLGSVGLQALIAYSIATRRMLDMPSFLRRGAAYGLLLLVLGSLYVAVWLAVDALDHPFGYHEPLVPSLIATLAVALAMGPSRNVLQRFVTRLVGNWYSLDPNVIFPETDAALRSVTTTHVVLRKFGRLCQRAIGTEHISIYLRREGTYQVAWRSQVSSPPPLESTGTLIQALTHQQRPFYIDDINHREPGSPYRHALEELRSRGGVLALGLYNQTTLTGFVLLGEKLSGRLYDDDQQAVLQVMVNRLAIALENASLYTRIHESKLNIETLVDQMLHGVVVIDEHQHISICNREAARLLGFHDTPLGKPTSCLPESLRQAVTATQHSGQTLRDQSTALDGPGGRILPIRYGCHTFGREGVFSRATCLVLDDLTQLKRIEEQLRRSDRLSSLGTLSASVAHEIKNPLVAIKTFVQLLPERHDDRSFLEHFGQLMGGEVNRIDNIVNQLLTFAKPGQARFERVPLHHVLDNTLRLMSHDLTRANIQCVRAFNAPDDHVWADRQKLEQVILNLVLNAQDAMNHGGTLTLTTANDERHLIVELHDDGPGLTPEARQKAFDPFFTTKDTGTGLGLSIVYGIIVEHGGTIELRNRPDRGTCVHIQLPLHQEPVST